MTKAMFLALILKETTIEVEALASIYRTQRRAGRT
jgi:hypothetical protein